MTFGDAIKSGFRKGATFRGRASRGEYWWFSLFSVIVWAVAFFLDTHVSGGLFLLPLSVCLLGVPGLSLSVRRFHDANHSGWWLGLLPISIAVMIGLLSLMGDDVTAFATCLQDQNRGQICTALQKFYPVGFLYFAIMAMGIWFLVWLASPGTDGPNRFGDPP